MAARSEQDELVLEIFDTTSWRIVTDRVKEHAAELRASVFNDSLTGDVRLGKIKELAGIRALFDRLYREVGREMPADFRKAFE